MDKVEHRNAALGTFHTLSNFEILKVVKRLPDEVLLLLAQCSRYWYFFAREVNEWKKRAIKKHGASLKWRGTWFRSYWAPLEMEDDKLPAKTHIPLEGLRCAPLNRRWKIRNTNTDDWKELPSNLAAHKQVPRESGLSVSDFDEKYGQHNLPVIFTDVVPTWPAYEKWSREKMVERFANTSFKLDQPGADGKKMLMNFKEYMKYSESTIDADPMYLFDPLFDRRDESLLEDYEIPPYFNRDLFQSLDDEPRPYYRWLVIGPARSGSAYHQDPYKTSAWNALLRGVKRWFLYPPHVLPPGAQKDDDDDYSAPDPLEWMVDYYPRLKDVNGELAPIQFLQKPGDLVFVPSGWWHMVLNVTETIAVTQNFCDQHNFLSVFEDVCLDDKKLGRLFYAEVEKQQPDLLPLVRPFHHLIA